MALVSFAAVFRDVTQRFKIKKKKKKNSNFLPKGGALRDIPAAKETKGVFT